MHRFWLIAAMLVLLGAGTPEAPAPVQPLPAGAHEAAARLAKVMGTEDMMMQRLDLMKGQIAAAMPTADVVAFTTAQIPQLSTGLVGIGTAELSAFSTSQVRAFTPAQIKGLATAQLQGLSTAGAQALWPLNGTMGKCFGTGCK